MERSKVIKRVNNLKKIRGIIEIAKFDTLQKLSLTEKIKEHHYEMAKISGDVLSYANSKHAISSSVANLVSKKIQPRRLWLFVTIPSLLIKVSYSNLEELILKNINKANDQVIAVGDPAITFVKKKKLKTFSEHHSLDESDDVTVLLNEIIRNNTFDEILIVSNTPRIKNEPLKIFPVDIRKEEIRKLKKMKFYYSLPEVIDNINISYIGNTISGIFQETKRHFYKEKLAKHESSIKNVDARIQNLTMTLNKIERKHETEEMIQVSQIVKRKG